MKKILWNNGWTFTADGGEAQAVTLPHDAMQAAGRAPAAPSGCGGAHYLGGRYVYEKTFCLSAEEAELYLNGNLVGRKAVAEMRAFFTLPYEAGQLEAVAYDADGTVVGRDALTSAGKDLHWHIRCESDSPEAGKVAYFTVTLGDEQGNVESNRDAELTLSVTGGTLLGFGSAKVRTTAEFLDGRYPSYYGRALAAVRIEDPENFTICVCE